jgi:hypothetical protein
MLDSVNTNKKYIVLAIILVILLILTYLVYPRSLFDGLYYSANLQVEDDRTIYWKFSKKGRIERHSGENWIPGFGFSSLEGYVLDYSPMLNPDNTLVLRYDDGEKAKVVAGFNCLYLDIIHSDGEKMRLYRVFP